MENNNLKPIVFIGPALSGKSRMAYGLMKLQEHSYKMDASGMGIKQINKTLSNLPDKCKLVIFDECSNKLKWNEINYNLFKSDVKYIFITQQIINPYLVDSVFNRQFKVVLFPLNSKQTKDLIKYIII